MASDTESGNREVVEFTPTDRNPKGKSTLQKSKSLELNSSQAGRALGTLKVFNQQELRAKSKRKQRTLNLKLKAFNQHHPKRANRSQTRMWVMAQISSS